MSVALTGVPTSDSTQQEPLRVMVVDDSVVIRGLLSRWIGAEPDMVVAASLRTGRDAVNQIERVNPDVAHIARALHAGANEYIMKPFDKDIVTAKFQEVGLI
jgi:PleD family two-component response regulator